MPIPKPESGELEEKYISRCIGEIGNEYDAEGQAYAVCKGEFDNPTQLQEEDIQAIYDRLPAVEKGELEEPYVERCIPTLYPSDYDQQQAASFCADHYSNKITIGLMKTKLSIMKSKPLSDFDRKKMEFMEKMIELKEKGIYVG